MDLHACAQFLHVSSRTVHNWEAGKHDIPYATYKLLRLLNRMELPGQAWQGWCFYGNKLISPEGRSLSVLHLPIQLATSLNLRWRCIVNNPSL